MLSITDIIMIVFAAVLTFALSQLSRKIDKKDKADQERQKKADQAAEERQRELIVCRVTEMKFARGTGSLAHIAAVAVKKAEGFPIGNGDLQKAIEYYKDCEHDLEDYYQKLCVTNNVKGG